MAAAMKTVQLQKLISSLHAHRACVFEGSLPSLTQTSTSRAFFLRHLRQSQAARGGLEPTCSSSSWK